MQRKLTPKEIINLSNESILDNLNNSNSFDNETVLIIYAEAQERGMVLSPDLLFKLLEFSSKCGWEDLNEEILKYTKYRGFESYPGYRMHINDSENTKANVVTEKEVPLTPLRNSANSVQATESSSDLLSKQLNEVVDAMFDAGDSLGKVFGSLIGQLCSFIGYVIFMVLIEQTAVSRSGREDGLQTITGIYVILSLFFLIRMFVFLSRSSNKLKNIKFSLSR